LESGDTAVRDFFPLNGKKTIVTDLKNFGVLNGAIAL
jgi:hypothetical protein